jgi:hypothetical protein
MDSISTLSDFETYMQQLVLELFPEGMIPEGTYLFHGSLSKDVLGGNDSHPITYFGLEPSISVWKNIESMDEPIVSQYGVNVCKLLRLVDKIDDYFSHESFSSYVHIFRTTRDLPFTYIREIQCHPDNVCMNKGICLHPQVAFHGHPDCFLTEEEEIKDELENNKYKYNITFEVTVNNINLGNNNDMKHVDTLVIEPRDTGHLFRDKFEKNKDILPDIYGLFKGNYMNEKINKEIIYVGEIMDNLLGQGIDVYDTADDRPDCSDYDYAMKMDV